MAYFVYLCLPDAVVIFHGTGRISSQWQLGKIFPAVPQCALWAELNNNHKDRITPFLLRAVSTQEAHQCATYSNPVHEGSKEEHKQLHCGHGILEELSPVILLLIGHGAGPGMPWWSLVFSLVDKGTAAPSPAGASVSSKSVIAAVLRSLQQHPVKSVKQLGFSYSKLILMSCMEKCITLYHRVSINDNVQSCTGGWTSNSHIHIWKLKFYHEKHQHSVSLYLKPPKSEASICFPAFGVQSLQWQQHGHRVVPKETNSTPLSVWLCWKRQHASEHCKVLKLCLINAPYWHVSGSKSLLKSVQK